MEATIEQLKTFADRNLDRHLAFHCGEADDDLSVCVEAANGTAVVHLWLSECCRFPVHDPLSYWGGKAVGEWITKANEAIERGL